MAGLLTDDSLDWHRLHITVASSVKKRSSRNAEETKTWLSAGEPLTCGYDGAVVGLIYG
jgi:hypothetical protein